MTAASRLFLVGVDVDWCESLGARNSSRSLTRVSLRLPSQRHSHHRQLDIYAVLGQFLLAA